MWELDQLFNAVEGSLWIGIAGFLSVAGLRKSGIRKLAFGAAITFLLFGLSDFIEIQTRAWYSPMPLLFLKGVCVLSLIFHFLGYRKLRGSR